MRLAKELDPPMEAHRQKTRAPAWSAAEIDAAIAIYLLMRDAVNRSHKYNKAEIIRAVQIRSPGNDAPLASRSRGSIEAKLMNITACLEDIDRDDLSMADHGYRPLSNYQKALKIRVAELVKDVTPASLADFAAAAMI